MIADYRLIVVSSQTALILNRSGSFNECDEPFLFRGARAQGPPNE